MIIRITYIFQPKSFSLYLIEKSAGPEPVVLKIDRAKWNLYNTNFISEKDSFDHFAIEVKNMMPRLRVMWVVINPVFSFWKWPSYNLISKLDNLIFKDSQANKQICWNRLPKIIVKYIIRLINIAKKKATVAAAKFLKYRSYGII